MVFGKKLNGAEEYIPFKYEPGMIRLDANESYADMPDEMKNKVLPSRDRCYTCHLDAMSSLVRRD